MHQRIVNPQQKCARLFERKLLLLKVFEKRSLLLKNFNKTPTPPIPIVQKELYQFFDQELYSNATGLKCLRTLKSFRRQLDQKCDGKPFGLTTSSRRFFQRHAIKTLLCLKEHCNSNNKTFWDFYGRGKFPTTNFECIFLQAK